MAREGDVNGIMGGDLNEWVIANLWQKEKFGHEKWGLIFGVTCWFLWKARNVYVFQEEMQEGIEVAARICAFVDAFSRLPSSNNLVFSEGKWGMVCWNCLQARWFKLNSDGSVRGIQFQASAGGVIRDFNGKWLVGYAHRIGSCSIAKAELWGLLDGLNIAWDRGFRRVEVELDSLFVVNVVQQEGEAANDFSSIVQSIKELLGRDWMVNLKHVFREANKSADRMANFATSLPLGCHIFDNPIPGILPLLLQDISGASFPRFGVM